MTSKTNLIEKGIQLGSYPEKLYKYRTMEQANLILDDFNFWFALPDSFNDPFDCNLSENPNPTKNDLATHFQRMGSDPWLIEKTKELNDTASELIPKLIKDAKDNSIKNKGVLSLSKKHDNILMWSHYSEYHQGIVFGLELRKDLGFFVSPINIEYQDTYDLLNYLKDPSKSIIDTLKIKSKQWKYEAEVRVYKDHHGLYPIDPSAFSDIYFGVNTPQIEVERMIELCKQKGLKHITFHRASKIQGEFKLSFDQF